MHAPMHVTPQVPQLFGSVCSFTHVPLHPVSPTGQQTPFEEVSPFGQTQLPAWQLAPDGQVLAHAPQLLVSVCSSTQALPQPLSPVGQQFPPEAVSPLGHTQLPF
jgi:hypothetical protein